MAARAGHRLAIRPAVHRAVHREAGTALGCEKYTADVQLETSNFSPPPPLCSALVVRPVVLPVVRPVAGEITSLLCEEVRKCVVGPAWSTHNQHYPACLSAAA